MVNNDGKSSLGAVLIVLGYVAYLSEEPGFLANQYLAGTIFDLAIVFEFYWIAPLWLLLNSGRETSDTLNGIKVTYFS